VGTSFPTGLDSLTNPTGASLLTSPDHAGQHSDINDAVEALEAKVGVNGSGVATSIDYKLTNDVVLKSLVDAKGDLITATADNTPARLAVGTTNGQVLVADSTTSTGLGYKLMRTYKPASGSVIRPAANITSATPAQSRLVFLPIEIASCTVVLMLVQVNAGAASSTVRMGIYESDSSGFPSTLLLDAGTVSSTTSGQKSIVVNQTLSSGRFWIAAVSQGGTPTMQTQTNTSMFSLGFQRDFPSPAVPNGFSSLYGANPEILFQDSVTGSLPSTATPSYNNTVNRCHVVGLEIG